MNEVKELNTWRDTPRLSADSKLPMSILPNLISIFSAIPMNITASYLWLFTDSFQNTSGEAKDLEEPI